MNFSLSANMSGFCSDSHICNVIMMSPGLAMSPRSTSCTNMPTQPNRCLTTTGVNFRPMPSMYCLHGSYYLSCDFKWSAKLEKQTSQLSMVMPLCMGSVSV